MHINDFAVEVYENNLEKGFVPADNDIENWMPNQLLNLHAEITELHDAYREGKEFLLCDKASKMAEIGVIPLSCQEEELADIIIRTLGIMKVLKMDIEAMLESKHRYNLTRPYKHGKKN